MKICNECKKNKPFSQFHKQVKAKDGHQRACKECNKLKVKAWQKDNPEYWLTQKNRLDRISIQRRARIYGISEEEVVVFLELNKCQLCNKDTTSETKHIDHDHITGAVRGVLCGKCNRGLGHFDDSIEMLEKAIEYLRRSMK